LKATTDIQYSLVYPVLFNPVLSQIRSKTDEVKPEPSYLVAIIRSRDLSSLDYPAGRFSRLFMQLQLDASIERNSGATFEPYFDNARTSEAMNMEGEQGCEHLVVRGTVVSKRVVKS
jgi:hypothetical protein